MYCQKCKLVFNLQSKTILSISEGEISFFLPLVKLLKIWTVIFLFRNMGPGNVMKSPLGDPLTFPWTLWDSNRAPRGCICRVYEGYVHYWFVVVQSLSCVQLFMTLWTAAHQASLSLLKLLSIESVMPSKHFILCYSLLHLPQSFPASGSLHQVAKVLELQFQHQSFQWVFRVDFL